MKIAILVMITTLLLVAACSVPQEKQATVVAAEEESVVVQAGVATVTAENFAFKPTDVEVTVGTTVEWSNKDEVEHSITFDDGSFDELLPPGGMVTHTFTQAGAYSYHCTPHPGMQGKVIVR